MVEANFHGLLCVEPADFNVPDEIDRAIRIDVYAPTLRASIHAHASTLHLAKPACDHRTVELNGVLSLLRHLRQAVSSASDS